MEALSITSAIVTIIVAFYQFIIRDSLQDSIQKAKNAEWLITNHPDLILDQDDFRESYVQTLKEIEVQATYSHKQFLKDFLVFVVLLALFDAAIYFTCNNLLDIQLSAWESFPIALAIGLCIAWIMYRGERRRINRVSTASLDRLDAEDDDSDE